MATGLVSFTSNDLGVEFISSRLVADMFKLRHDNVLQKINGLIDDCNLLPLNFQVSEYKDSTGRTLPMYLLDANGFNLLTASFNFKKEEERELQRTTLQKFSEGIIKLLKQVKAQKQRINDLEASEQKALGSNYPRKKTATMGYILQHNEGEEFPKRILVSKEGHTAKELAEGMIDHSKSIIHGHELKIKKLEEFIELCD